MTKKPFILITNDDGFDAPGIKHLWHALADYADLALVAPATDQSGMSLGVTMRTPLQITQISWERDTPAWKVSGTPADCVRMALSVLLERTPDFIVSGINRGANSGRVVLYSGTVGGVIEGVLRNIPGIAFSCCESDSLDYLRVEKYIQPVVSHLLDYPLPAGTLLNVNFPDTPEIKGFKMTHQGKGYYIEDTEKRIHPEGYPYYWLSGKWSDHEEHEESDTALLKQGYATAVPIHVNTLTDVEHLTQHKHLFDAALLSGESTFKGI